MSSNENGTVTELLARGREGLAVAQAADAPQEQFVQAHLAALRAAAAWVSLVRVPSRCRPPRSVWEHLSEADPEMGLWSQIFTVSGRRRLEAERGVGSITALDARTLLDQAREFATEVEARLCDCPARHSGWPSLSEMARIAGTGCPVHGHRATPVTA